MRRGTSAEIAAKAPFASIPITDGVLADEEVKLVLQVAAFVFKIENATQSASHCPSDTCLYKR
jgi:hypothetical protein